MQRIDPAYPPLWRTPTMLQFGRSDRARLDEPALWHMRHHDGDEEDLEAHELRFALEAVAE